MLFIIPVYAWVWFFLQTGEGAIYFDTEEMIALTHVALPWGTVDLNTALMGFFPVWIIIYTMVSLPIGQIENRLIRFIFLKKHLAELDREVKRAEIE